MATLRRVNLLLQLSVLVQISLAAGDRSVLDIVPPSFLSGVSQNVQLTCRPPTEADVTQVVTIQIYKSRDHGQVQEPLASYVTSGSPVVEALGGGWSASASGSYDVAHSKSAFLRVNLPQPTDSAGGRYTCSVETLDGHGLLHTYLGYAHLTSLAKNGSVPVFYHRVLQELKADLQTMTSDLQNVANTQVAVNDVDHLVQAKLSSVDNHSSNMQGLINNVNSFLNDVNHQVATMRSQLSTLRHITPEYPVNFYAYMSTASVAPAVNADIVFNVLQQHSNSNYSTTTGVFTAPLSGTYYFTTGITGKTNVRTYAAITVRGQEVASLFAFDDYQLTQSSASVVVLLMAGDEVAVVKKLGAYIYGSNNVDHITYFMGMLLW